MTKTMKAALMTAPGQPLEIHDVPVPTPGPGEILAKIDVCGLCHTDLHFWKGDHALPRDLPVKLTFRILLTPLISLINRDGNKLRLQQGDNLRIGKGRRTVEHAVVSGAAERMTVHRPDEDRLLCLGRFLLRLQK